MLEDIISKLQDVLLLQRGLTFDQLVISIMKLENADTHYGH
jgi:hypothetical protein